MSEDFTSDILINAYSQGYFPMAEEKGEIYWHCPDPRAVIPLDKIKKPRSLTKYSRKNNFKYSVNSDFEFVIRACSDRQETWISSEIIDIYLDLHKKGFAHSVETWSGNEIVGGLYGISLGAAFFGESMFNNKNDAAKAAFYYLAEYLKSRGFILLDSQYINPFTQQLGAVEIRKKDYIKKLEQALIIPITFD
jgi:leucyl/phenylalanyl-tRNA---protein transferase